MTKYILHGGETGIPNNHNEAFYREWIKDFKNNFTPTILLVYFSRPREEWEKLEKQDKERFAKYTNNRQVNFIVANKDIDTFRGQIKTSNVIYVRGCSSEDLIKIFTPLKSELVSILDGKIYAGSSAGVMVLANYTCSTSGYWKNGLGILPLNSFVHWNNGLIKELEAFKREHTDNNLEWLLIPETEFIIKYF